MRLAILGGSFNPIHIGHLALAEAALSLHNYHRIIFLPAFQSPLKSEASGAGAGDRLDMILASIAGEPRFTVDDYEIRRAGVSYTIDSIGYIEKKYCPGGKLGLILGDDLAGNFPKWKKADELARRVDLLLARRVSEEKARFPYPHLELHNDRIEVSSGEIRERIRQKKGWQYLVSRDTALIIKERKLYDYAEVEAPAAKTAAGKLPAGKSPAKKPRGEAVLPLIVRIEEEALHTLDQRRFLHSRATALLAWDLARAYGLDAGNAYLAGIGHDLCKSFPSAELFRLARRDGKRISVVEREKPELLHARAAAVYLKERFGIENEDVLEAVRLHTFSEAGMGPLAKIVYIADKTENGREDIPGGRRIVPGEMGLDELFGEVLGGTAAYLKSRKLVISRKTLGALKDINHEKRKD